MAILYRGAMAKILLEPSNLMVIFSAGGANVSLHAEKKKKKP